MFAMDGVCGEYRELGGYWTRVRVETLLLGSRVEQVNRKYEGQTNNGIAGLR